MENKFTRPRLQDRVCVITGAASGIGRACALRYAQEGGKVVVADINTEQGQEVVASIQKQGGRAFFQATNVEEPAQLDNLLQVTINTFGQLHLWHNNAFRSIFKNVLEQTLQEFDDTMRISLRAYWYGSKIAATHMMAEEGGVIINTASVQSYFGEAGFSAYQCAKGGILAMTRSMGVELAPKVRVVAIAPGFIHTPAHTGIPADTINRVIEQIPAKRGAEPEEVAALAAFLASPEADYITATGIIIDGGYLGI